jgi:ribosomal protein S18 acetylase RimI-like enzyme
VYFQIRNFSASDAERVNELAVDAFSAFRDEYSDWKALARTLGNTAALAESGEMIVATRKSAVVGAVVYVASGLPKREFFDPEWPIVRMLVVSPQHQRLGIGRALMDECVRRAVRDRAPLIALHTSPIMKVALPLYLRMGFVHHRDAPALMGVPYGIYVKLLG